ncbi:S8 family peptidase [Falsibacillus pallidus]|uniref:Subtilisin n=1 Tax=Falsibacillus pallidus TaxID=493781 RepID=A0A370G871_9BACI|nr:S8 family serine peptidase [Falsibacillus pallidus]RDI39981.1 subtilisin [Falsibacillus pallidus]
MKTVRIILGALLLFSILPQITHAQTLKKNYIVHFNKMEDRKILEKFNINPKEKFKMIPAAAVSLTERQAATLEKSNSIKSIVPEVTYKMSSQTTPWAFGKMNITNQVRTIYTGKGVKVVVIDTGVDSSHPDLRVAGGTCVLNSCPNGFQDDNGHGTHVAGIIAAQNNSVGIVGVAPDVELYSVKALDTFGAGTTTTIVKGLEWAIEQHADIVNLSFTTKSDDPTLREMVQKASDAGILLVGAAGNSGTATGTGDNVLYPAKYDNVIAVSALDSQSKRIVESSTGAEVEVAAPGNNIISTVPLEIDTFDGNKDGYMPMTGTSMASPYVAGLLALYKERYPNYSRDQLRSILDQNAQDIGMTGRDAFYGYGLALFGDKSVLELPSSAQVISHEDGKVAFAFHKSTGTKPVDIYRDGQTIAFNILNENWDDYVEKGTYQYQFVFHNEDGSTTKQSLSVSMDQPAFDDLDTADWYAPHMIYLYHESILNGLDSHTILPSKKITRGEAVAMIGRAKGYNGNKGATEFSDVGSGYFASGYIQSAYEHHILNGFPDGTFKPNQYVTRAEMAILIANAYGLANETLVSYADVNDNVTGEAAIFKIANAHITEGYPDGSFKPHEEMSRAKFSVFMARAENKEFITK